GSPGGSRGGWHALPGAYRKGAEDPPGSGPSAGHARLPGSGNRCCRPHRLNPMSIVRSLVFGVAAVLVTAPYGLFSLLTFPFRPLTRYRIITSYTRIMLWLVWHVLGIRYRVLGRENIPERASVILCKHQSAWETLALQEIFPPLSFVLKRELLRVPFL